MDPFTFFISYRREDTAPIALLLKYEIEKRIQFVRVFVDVGDIQPGEAFPARLEQAVANAHATIVLIGKNWMSPAGHEGEARPASEDWVVTEIAQSLDTLCAAPKAGRLAKGERFVLPLFVNGPRRFDRFTVPTEIKPLSAIQSEAIDYESWPVAIGPLIERIAVGLGLQKRPDADEYPKPDAAKARTQPLSEAELATILAFEDYEGWYVDNFGNSDVRYLAKTFKFPSFDKAARFMALVSDHCRVLDHHPEWRNVFNHVTVNLTTWDARRKVTIYDLNLALFMNKAAGFVIENHDI